MSGELRRPTTAGERKRQRQAAWEYVLPILDDSNPSPHALAEANTMLLYLIADSLEQLTGG